MLICIKCYVKSEDQTQENLELLLDDIERCVDANRVLVYDQDNNLEEEYDTPGVFEEEVVEVIDEI